MNEPKPIEAETSVAIKPTGFATTPKPFPYALWKHMSEVYGLTMLESELNEIVILCDRGRTVEFTERAGLASAEICQHLGQGWREDPHVTRCVLSVVGMEFANVPRTLP